MLRHVIVFLATFVAICAASACTSSHDYSTSAESGHLGCDSYGDRLTISWLIQLQTDKRILLTFDTFDTEANYDFVRIYDGTNSDAPLLGAFSGSVIPGPFSSSSNSMLIVFTADEYVEGDGFTASWASFSVPEGVVPCTTSTHLQLSGDSGNFGCDGYGNQISSSWAITGTAGERIVLTFHTFATEAIYDVVTVYDGSDANANVVGTFSGSDLPPPVTATGNHLYVTLTSDYSLNSAGFSASWSSLVQFADPCFNNTNKLLIPREGYLGCPYGYGNNVNSTWLINVVGNFIVRLTFLTLDTEEGVDFVTVYDGTTTAATVLGRFSGSSTPEPVTASANRMLVALTTNNQNVASGFTATYESVHALQPNGCSRSGTFVLTDAQDSLGCNGYLGGVTEEWHISSRSPDEIINLTWQSFDTEAGHDIVYVYDGNSTADSLVYSSSGSNLPDPVVSTGQWLLVKFIADNNGNQGTGFGAVFESVVVEDNSYGCMSTHHYHLSGPEGNFGCDGYANDVTTTWSIEVEEGFLIMLQFETFFTETLYDFVTVYDGPDINAEPLGSWSGTFKPPDLSSSSNFLFVVFTSDSGVTRRGFSASYSSVFSGNDAGSCFSNKQFTLTGDGGSFGCNGYGGNVEVTWAINAPSGTTIDLTFTEFQTEFNYDILRIYDGTTVQDRLLASYSGYVIPDAVHSSSNHLFLSFESDEAVQYDGFVAQFHAVEQAAAVGPCTTTTHETLTAPAGQFGCNKYGNDLDSSWTINAAEGKRITLSFTQLSTELYYDYIKVYDGANTQGPLIGTYSGELLPPPITSTGKSLYITFHSDTSVSSTYEGFILDYVTFGSFHNNCNSNQAYEIDSSSGTFGCDGYREGVTVTWLISSSGNIFLNFEQFSTELNYDILYIYDGPNANSPLIAQYSGSQAPPISSSGDSLFLKFVSDASLNESGFTANFVSVVIDMAPPRDQDH